MTNSDTSLKIPNREQMLRSFYAIFFGGIAIFALNLFALEPLMSRVIGPLGGMFVYMAIRILATVALGFGLTRYAGRNRFQVVSTVLFIGFLDQVLFKGIGLHHEFHSHPEKWIGADTSNVAIFVNLSMVFLPFIPVLVILSLFGIEATRFRREWKR